MVDKNFLDDLEKLRKKLVKLENANKTNSKEYQELRLEYNKLHVELWKQKTKEVFTSKSGFGTRPLKEYLKNENT